MYAAGMRLRVRRTTTASEKWPGHDPLPYPNGHNLGKTGVRLGSCVGVGLTSGTAVEETDYRQTPTSPAARWLSQRNNEVEEIAVARTPTNMVSDGSHAGGVCRTPGRECLFWPMPPYYSQYYLQQQYRGFEVLVTYSEHINIWPTSHCGQISWSLCQVKKCSL